MMRFLVAIIAALFVLTSQAEARHYRHHHYRHHHRHHVHRTRHHESYDTPIAMTNDGRHISRHEGETSYGRPSDCYGIPWCGCFMKHLMASALSEADKRLNLNLARDWAYVGRATSPHVGAIVVWPHHVGKIVGQDNGVWIILSGNDGHRVRERARSVARAIAFRDL